MRVQMSYDAKNEATQASSELLSAKADHLLYDTCPLNIKSLRRMIIIFLLSAIVLRFPTDWFLFVYGMHLKCLLIQGLYDKDDRK